jgi:hypothetical protein
MTCFEGLGLRLQPLQLIGTRSREAGRQFPGLRACLYPARNREINTGDYQLSQFLLGVHPGHVLDIIVDFFLGLGQVCIYR